MLQRNYYGCSHPINEQSRKKFVVLWFVVPAAATIISSSVVVEEGNNVTLACNGTGLPVPSVIWFNALNVVMENGNVLYNISRNMTGQYTCTARNPCGNDSKKVDIDVQCESSSNFTSNNIFLCNANCPCYNFVIWCANMWMCWWIQTRMEEAVEVIEWNFIRLGGHWYIRKKRCWPLLAETCSRWVMDAQHKIEAETNWSYRSHQSISFLL